MYRSTVLLAFVTIAVAVTGKSCNVNRHCLNNTEAAQIATRYLSLYNTGNVTQLSDVTNVVTANFTSYDGTGTGPYNNGPATNGSDAFYQSLTANSGPSSFNDSVQTPEYFIHTCDTIVYRWQFTAVSTGYNATVPAGTRLAFEGTDIINVDLGSRKVYNATSSADWINLARELGQIGNYFP